MNKKILQKVFIINIVLLFAGCAVLTVDVDVYKGPLANHQDIQVEQMAAMAIGAKPLLIELRDRLEAEYMKFVAEQLKEPNWPDSKQIECYKKWGRKDLDTRLAKLREQEWYKPEFVALAGADDYSPFKDFDADNVNNILCLYKNRISEEQTKLYDVYSEFLNVVNKIVARYVENYDILRPANMRQDEVLARKVREEFEKKEKDRSNKKTAQAPSKKVKDTLIDKKTTEAPVKKEETKLAKKEVEPLEDKEKEELVKEEQDTSDPKTEVELKENLEVTGETTKHGPGSKLRDIWEAYDKFLCQNQRDALEITDKLFIYLEDASPQSPALEKLKSKSDAEAEALKHVTNAAHRLLVETEIVDACAEEFFGLKGNLKDQFISRVKEIASAYLNSRKALEDLWLTTMNGIIRINSQPVEPNKSSRHYDEFTAKIVDFSLHIIQPRYLAVLLDNKDKINLTDINDLALSLGLYPQAEPTISNKYWSFNRMKEVLAERLKKEPAGIANILIAIHQYSQSGLDPNETSIAQYVGQGDLQSLAFKEGWIFGLVRAPFDERQDNKQVDKSPFSIAGIVSIFSRDVVERDLRSGWRPLSSRDLEMSFEKIEYVSGGALAKGRLNDGLETFIEDYLKKANECNPDNPKDVNDLQCARDRLSDALVRFAKKLLFLANNRSLISPPKNQGLIIGINNVLFRGLLGEGREVTDLLGWSPEDTNQNVRILQAVGNSILVQADALHQEKEHKKQLENQYKREVAILTDTVRKMSPVDQNTVDIKTVNEMLPKTKNPKPTAKDVRDVWITLLEYEHDLALHDGKKDRADQILEAIKAARAKREGMIFIRPAMAYLRTSFPATSLQGNPNLTWDNMLGGHMMRSIPFAPQIGEFLDPDAKRDARITAEIDKQFWQNINRVRVAGGGRTNYAVVKDDIGNWYVKGYSANPEDIIQSAQNLALFSAGGMTGTLSMVPSGPTTEPNQVRVTPGSTLDSMLDKYEKDYREKTQQGYKLLYSIMHNSEENIRKQIKELWKANVDANKKQNELETALEWSYTHFLKPFAPEVKENVKDDINKQRAQILEGIKRLKQFRNDLIWKITNVYSQDGKSADPNIPTGKLTAKSIVRNVVDSQINDLVANRKDAIKTYENALMFLAEATKPQQR